MENSRSHERIFNLIPFWIAKQTFLANDFSKLSMYYLKYFPNTAPYSWLSVKIRRSRKSESLVKLKFSFCVNSTSNFLRHKSQSSCNVLFCGVFTRLMFSAVGCFPLQMAAISIQIGTSQHTNLQIPGKATNKSLGVSTWFVCFLLLAKISEVTS